MMAFAAHRQHTSLNVARAYALKRIYFLWAMNEQSAYMFVIFY